MVIIDKIYRTKKGVYFKVIIKNVVLPSIGSEIRALKKDLQLLHIQYFAEKGTDTKTVCSLLKRKKSLSCLSV